MNVALVGCGRISQVAHLPALAKVEELQLVAAMDPSRAIADGVAQQWGAQAFTDLGACLEQSQPHAVIITAPDRAHAPLARQALEAGVHVLVEKPMTSTLEQAQELAAVADASGRILQVGTMKRHDAGLIFARAAVAQRLGRVLSFTAWYRTTSLRENFPQAFFPPVISDPDVVSTEAGFKADKNRYFLLTHGSHLWDLIRYVLGDVKRLRALRAGLGPDISWQSVVELAGGAIGCADLTIDQHGEGSEGFSVRCERGSLEVRTFTPFARRASIVRLYEDGAGAITQPVFAYQNSYEWQLRAFANAIERRDVPDADVEHPWGVPADAHDGLEAMRLLDAVQDSVERGDELVLDG